MTDKYFGQGLRKMTGPNSLSEEDVKDAAVLNLNDMQIEMRENSLTSLCITVSFLN